MTQIHKADVVIFLVTVLAAVGWIATKAAMAELPPMAFLCLRFISAGFVVLACCYKELLSLTARQWRFALWVSLAQASGMALWIMAMGQAARISEGAFITSTLVIMVPFVGRLLFGAQISRATLVALPFAVPGLGLLGLNGGWNFEIAQLLFLACAVFMAIHINCLSYFGREVLALPLTAIQLFSVGTAGFIGWMLFESLPEVISVAVWGWLVVAIFIATSLRFFLQTWGFKHSNPNSAAVIMILEPVWISVLSMLWFGESLDGQKTLGCVLILVALFVTRSQQLKLFLSGLAASRKK